MFLHALLAVLLLCACAPPPALRPASATLLETATVEPLPYAASPMFSAQYYVFRDVDEPAWGAGKTLAAYWRKELGFESRLNGLGAGSGAVLAVESSKEGRANLVIALDAHGVVVSSSAFSGAFDEFRVLRAKTRSLFAVRDFWTVTVADPARGALWSPPGEYDGIAAADLDGDGQDELLARDRKGVLSAFSADGGRLWSRSGLPELHGLVSGRLEGRGTPSLVARSGPFGDGRLFVLNGRGRVELSAPVAWSEASLTAVASGRLAAVGHAYPEERDFLSLSAAGGAQVWRFDLGWTDAAALAAVDLDGDGRDEIALGTASGWVLVFSDEGKLLAEKNFQGEVSHLLAVDGRRLLVALKGIPPRIYAVGVIPAPGAWKSAAAEEPVRAAAAAIESPGGRLRAHAGRLMPSLADRILKSPPYLEAKRLADDPRMSDLPEDERKSLEVEWQEVQAERAVLLHEARNLDREGDRLFRRGLKLEKAAASLGRERDALRLSIEHCRMKCASLERKAGRLELRIGGHNDGVAAWREEVSGLERRVGLEP